jgi:pimeloyl-ACP methyl ester carboxylesterase
MPTATTDDGVAISYATAGEGPPHLLFMHGWAGSGRYFDATLSHLDLTRLSAVTFDLRGHRESDPSNDGYSVERIAADALAVADAAGLGEFVVVGFSMSAKFCQYVSVVAPDRVAGQILIAGCPAGAIPLPREMTDDWLSRAGDPVRMAQVSEPFMTRPVAPELIERFGRDAATIGRAALEGTLDAAMTSSFADRLASIRGPSLVIGGTGDPMFPPDALRAAVVPPLAGARLALIDCGHEVPLEAPAELAALIEAFLAGSRRWTAVVEHAVMLRAVRIGLPVVIAVAGILLVLSGSEAAVGAGIVLIGVAGLVVVANLLIRLSIMSQEDREREAAERERRWPRD